MTADLGERIARVQERIADAARRAGRDPDEVTLVAVCKTVGRAEVDEAYRAGLRHFGENRVQEARAKFGAGRRLPVLIEINVAGEESKQGADAVTVPALVEQVVARPELELRGL